LFYWQIWTWKILFQTIQRIFHEKNGPDFEERKFQLLPDFHNNFQQVAKNRERFWFIKFFDLKNIISWEKWLKLARFWRKKKLQIARFLQLLPAGSQKYRKTLIHQIWTWKIWFHENFHEKNGPNRQISTITSSR
jgi:hypothetical protein